MNFNKFPKAEIVQAKSSDHNMIKLDISNRIKKQKASFQLKFIKKK
jgi:hypothetical protein